MDFEWEVIPNRHAVFYSGPIKSGKSKQTRIRKTQIASSTKGDELSIFNDKLEKITEKLSLLEKENVELKKIIFDNIFQEDLDEKNQYIPIDIYIDTSVNEKIFEVYSSVLDFAKNLGFIKILELPAVKNSWFKRAVAKSQEIMTSDQVTERFKEVEYGIEVNTILKQQSEIDKNESEALANILKSLDGIDNGAIRIGSLLVVKITDIETKAVNLQVRTLSIKEMYLINKNPNLLTNPPKVLEALSKAIEADNKITDN